LRTDRLEHRRRRADQGAGHLYNQVINGAHFLTQEEFSNKDFALTGGGCVQSVNAEA
jgi:hypothetical protein